MFSGKIGDSTRKAVNYSLVEQTESSFTFIVALEDWKSTRATPIMRYRVGIDRVSGEISEPRLVALSAEQLPEAILTATGNHVTKWERFTDGALSVSYKISVQQDADIEYMLQLRHHGDIASMNNLIHLVSTSIGRNILPLPAVISNRR